MVLMIISSSLFTWNYASTPLTARGERSALGNHFYGSTITQELRTSLIEERPNEICIIDSNENGVHDLKDSDIPVLSQKMIEIVWGQYEYRKIEIRSPQGLSWDDTVGTGYRYEVPLKVRHLFVPGIYAYRLINPYNHQCPYLVGRFEIPK